MRCAAVVLAACASAPPPPPIAQHVARPDAPATPAPTVAIADGQISTHGLPAVSADDSLVLFAQEAHEVARGYPALRLVLRDRSDRDVTSHYVIGFDDGEEPAAATAARFTEANRWLVAQHAAYHLQPMRPLAMTDRHAHGDGIAIDWQPSQLAISRGGAAPFILTTPQSWLVEDRPMYAGSSEMCHNEAFLLAASVDTERAIAVIAIAYMGSDTCWEPPTQEHVVHW